MKKILELRNQGRGRRLYKQALVKGTGYQELIWELFELVKDTVAMGNFMLQHSLET